MLNLQDKLPSDFKGYMVASLTDEYIVDEWPMVNSSIENKEDKILELRVFNETIEYKWFRTSIGDDFSFRKRDDEDSSMEMFEQIMLLDVNDKMLGATPGEINTAAGGKYFYPMSIQKGKSPAVKVKYYVHKYNQDDLSTIHSHVVDWRMVEFTEEEDK